eukprot:m.235391 g.235391  ORF g.235391 m.235391 type:complete len:234 (-) comp12816_c0_seq1:90-791(-)
MAMWVLAARPACVRLPGMVLPPVGGVATSDIARALLRRTHIALFSTRKAAKALPPLRTIAPEDRLLFVADRKSFFRFTAATSVSQAVFWLFVASFAADLREEVGSSEAASSKNPLDRPMSSLLLRSGMFVVSIGVAGLFLALGIIFPRRYVHTLKVLKGGSAVRVGTYNFIGERAFEVPLEKMVFTGMGRLANGASTTVRIEGHRWAYFLDGANGRIIDSELFHALQPRVRHA